MLFHSDTPFGQKRRALRHSLYTHADSVHHLHPPPVFRSLVDNDGDYLIDNDGDFLVDRDL